MLKSATLLSSVFGMGILLGLTLANIGRSAPAPEEPRILRSPPVPTAAGPALEPDPVAPPSVSGTPPALADALQANISRFTRQLEAASVARQQLQDELRVLKETVHILEQRLDELTPAEPVDEPQPPPVARARQNDPQTLIDAGFAPDEAAYLANRWGQQQMDLLYLRDQAIREGWIDTPRYEQEVLDLRSGGDSIREELGPEAYDRFLFASGRANRVVLNSIIDSSPAQTIGLQPGDAIVSYDGNRIFSFNDLRTATTSGEPGGPVVIEIERDGQLLALEIERGPIGVTLGRQRVEP